jgi:hypothetical protein
MSSWDRKGGVGNDAQDARFPKALNMQANFCVMGLEVRLDHFRIGD